MAKQSAKKGANGGSPAKGGGGGIIALVLLTLIGAGLGMGYNLYFMKEPTESQAKHAESDNKSSKDEQASREEGELAVTEGEARLEDGNTIVQLQPIVTDMRGEPKRWLRLEVSLVFARMPESGVDVVAQEASADILAFLRTVSLAQIEGPDGLEYLTDDIEELARIRSKGAVSRLLITSLVTE